MRVTYFIAGCLTIALLASANDFHPPAGNSYAQVGRDVTILPGGRAIKPLGTQIETGPGPFGLAISAKGRIAVANTGFERNGVAVLTPLKDSWNMEEIWSSPDDAVSAPRKPPLWQHTSYGIVFDGEKNIWIGEGRAGKVRLIDASSGDRRREISLDDAEWHGTDVGDLTLDESRKILYAIDRANNRVVAIDTVKSVLVASVKTVTSPFSIMLTPDRNTIYVTGRDSVAVIDVHDPRAPVAQAPLSMDSPVCVLQAEDRVYVSNERSDSISVLSAGDRKVVKEIPLRVPWMLNLRGMIPAGMAYDPVTKWLLVAEAGINAVAVIDTTRDVVIAHLPAGWYPVRVGLAGGKVWVINARGRGTGGNARRPLQDEYMRPSTFYRGTINGFAMPGKGDFQKLTSTTFAANGFFEDPKVTAEFPEGVKHVVLIVKKNRSFDEIFGDTVDAFSGTVLANPALARYGMHGHADGNGTKFSVKDIAVTPNEHSIAKEFSISDNFYADGETGEEGRSWLTGGIPGIRMMSSILQTLTAPEKPGPLWEHLTRNRITFRQFEPGKPEDSDQTRVDSFIGELTQRYKPGQESLPQFIWLPLTNDAAEDTSPTPAHAYTASWIADNDLAVGRVLDYLSHSPWWNEMAVFITEENALGGLDYVDAHRTIFLAAGPYVKRGYVSHTNSSFPGLLKTIFGLLHIPPLGLTDAGAPGMQDLFTDTPDYTPYTALGADKRIFDPTQTN